MTGLAALQSALAAEHAAIFVVGALGARSSPSEQSGLHEQLTDAYRAHVDRREALIAAVRDLGADPVAAEPAYDVPTGLGTSRVLRRHALRIQRACATAYTHLVANTAGDTRRLGIEALLDCAQRELDFGGQPRPLPGL